MEDAATDHSVTERRKCQASEEMERLLFKCGGGNPELTANTQETLREWRAKLMSENYGWWCVWRVCVNSVVLCGYLYTPQHIVDSEENLLAIDEGTPYHCASNITYEKFLS
jgi:hypothetical protein